MLVPGRILLVFQYCLTFYSVFKQLGLRMLATSRTDRAGFWVTAWQWMDLALFLAVLADRHHRADGFTRFHESFSKRGFP